MSISTQASQKAVGRNPYTGGAYLEKNPLWHTDESPFKVKQLLKMFRKNGLHPGTICEVGCGAGEVLNLLQPQLDNACHFWGYDISPQALEMCQDKTKERLQFKLGDISREEGAFFDLILVLDVIEHVEDYFGFLESIRPKSDLKIFHFP